MSGQNSHIHITIKTEDLERLRKEAEEEEISVSELIRRKLANPPTPTEIELFRKLKEFLGA
jgi:hypothetical protein